MLHRYTLTYERFAEKPHHPIPHSISQLIALGIPYLLAVGLTFLDCSLNLWAPEEERIPGRAFFAVEGKIQARHSV